MSFRPGLGRVALVVSVLVGAATGVEGQRTAKEAGNGFRLFARVEAVIEVNRVTCPVDQHGQLCYNDFHGTASQWPKGSFQFYIYNSGLQLAGTIESGIAGFGWSGDTTGAFFYDPKGTTQHGQAVEPVWNYSDSVDRATWPAMARVGLDDTLFAASLRGRASASDGDLWFLMWEGDPALNAGRSHPLGLAVEVRIMAWKGPGWNQDVIYILYTLHNISSRCASDYASVRPGLREELIALGGRFQDLNEAKFGVAIPDCGYGIRDLYAASAADPDVSSDAGENYSSVNLPFGMGYAYHDLFRGSDFGRILPADLRQPPFLDGFGLVGTKFLGTPLSDSLDGGIRIFSNTVGGGLFPDPQNVRQLFRYLSGNPSPAMGDGGCNNGTPAVTRICYVKQDGHADVRYWQSTGPGTVEPGQAVTVTVGYVFASAVSSPGCATAPCPSVLPGSPLRLTDAGLLASGANLIDSLAGFRGYVDDNSDGVVQAAEFRTVRGSLLFKAQLAQAIFDRKFLLPSAPAAPDFFLVPGDDQVAILWRPSATETDGDPFFTLASDPSSAAYDPNFRRFDTEGYRIYRGRVDDPGRLTLIAQYDHVGEDSRGHPLVFRDHLGVLNAQASCAPELGRNSIAQGCEIDFDPPPASGTAYSTYVEHRVWGELRQVRLGDRFLDANGGPYLVAVDTALTGGGSGIPEIWDSGVPFIHVDSTPRNNLRYFYSVTAFDVNSIQSGPSSLESARVVKAVTPVRPASNYRPDASWTVRPRGRGVFLDPSAPLPTLDAATGTFSGPMPPADGASLGLVGPFLEEVVAGTGEFWVRLDSLDLGQVDLTLCCSGGGPGVPARYHYTLFDGSSSTRIVLPLQQSRDTPVSGVTRFTGIRVHGAVGPRYGGSKAFRLYAEFRPELQPIGFAGGTGQAAILGQPGFTAAYAPAGASGLRYDGPRWYSGATETMANPTAANCGAAGSFAACQATTANPLPGYNNAGEVNGAGLVYMPHAGLIINREWRNMETIMAGAWRAADFRVYWGAPGVVDSVIDLTHNVVVPFDSAGGTDPNEEMGAGWGILTQAATSAAGSYDGRPGTHTMLDWTCVEPFRSRILDPDGAGPAGVQGFYPCDPGTEYTVQRVATLGPVAVGAGHQQLTGATNTASVRSPNNNNGGNGFSMYIAGTITVFGQMAALPTNTFWTLRTYSGTVWGGGGAGCATCNAGNNGLYRFVSRPRPMTAVGSELVFSYTATQGRYSSTVADLELVHTVPDPYYLTNGYETDPVHKVIKFVNLPDRANIRIYTLSGVLVRVIEHNSASLGGQADWDVRNSGGRLVASGVYFYHIEAPSGARRVGRMTLVTDGR